MIIREHLYKEYKIQVTSGAQPQYKIFHVTQTGKHILLRHMSGSRGSQKRYNHHGSVLVTPYKDPWTAYEKAVAYIDEFQGKLQESLQKKLNKLTKS